MPADQSTSAPPLTLAQGVYRPDFPNNLGAFDEYAAAAGRSLDIVSWYALWGGWKRDFSRADLDAVSARGATPLITWEPWAGQASDPAWSLSAAVLSGKNDAYVRSWADGLAAYHKPVLLRFAHEMHDQSYPWAVGVNGNTAQDYVASWRHVHQIFVESGATNVQWVWNPNTMAGSPREVYDAIYAQTYPGDAVVDWLGLDVYNGGVGLPSWGGWRSFGDALATPYAALAAVSTKPVILPEVGSAEQGGSKSEWIQSALGSLSRGDFPRVVALVWFDVSKEEAWTLHSSPAALQAWASATRTLPPETSLSFLQLQ